MICPGIDRRAIYMCSDCPITDPAYGSDTPLHQKTSATLMRQQTLPVLSETGGIKRRFLKVHTNEPAEQGVVTQLLTEHPVRAY